MKVEYDALGYKSIASDPIDVKLGIYINSLPLLLR